MWQRQRIFDRMVVFSIFQECVEYPEVGRSVPPCCLQT